MVGNLGLNANPKRAGWGEVSARPWGLSPALRCPGGLSRGGAEALSRGAHSSGAPPRAGYIENNHKSSQPVCLQEYPDWVGKSFKSPALLAGWPTPPARGLRPVFHWVASGLGCRLFCFGRVELGLSG